MSTALLALAAISSWTTWSARPEIAPKTARQGEILVVSGAGNQAAHGGWEGKLEAVKPGQWYRFTAAYRATGISHEHLQVNARLDWTDAKGERAGQPDYAWQTEQAGAWKKLRLEVPAPDSAAGAKVQLFLSNAASGKVEWKDVRIEEIAVPGPRNVTVAAINLRPERMPSREAAVAAFVDAIHRTVQQKVDLIVLPEGVTVVGTGKNYAEVAEPLPGPTTETLGRVAAKHKAWLVAGLYEREGNAIYNTSVLLDREGRLAGKYRKIYIPREEIEGGITPGGSYPVFRTDFGTVGMMICWDVQYADPARGLAWNGAEIIALPIWGGNELLAKARAAENRVFLVSSGYDYPTHIIDPDGKIVAEAKDRGTAAILTLDLNKRYLDPWLGDMRQRFHKELRLDVPVK